MNDNETPPCITLQNQMGIKTFSNLFVICMDVHVQTSRWQVRMYIDRFSLSVYHGLNNKAQQLFHGVCLQGL